MNFKRIHYFLTFCEHMHFSNAAKELRISQPALAKAISKLEEELGARLVRREGKNTHLTHYGQSARQVFISMMAHVYNVDVEIEQLLKSKRKQIRVAVQSALSFTSLAKFFASYHQAYPQVNVDIIDCEASDCDELLLKGEVDCLITHNCKSLDKNVGCLELYKDKLVVVDGNNSTSNSKCQHAVASGYQDELEANSILHRVTKGNGTSMEAVIRTKQQLWAQQLIKQGVGFGVVSEGAELIDGIGVCECHEILKTLTVSAAIPIGRSDCSVVAGFYYMLKEHRWV